MVKICGSPPFEPHCCGWGRSTAVYRLSRGIEPELHPLLPLFTELWTQHITDAAGQHDPSPLLSPASLHGTLPEFNPIGEHVLLVELVQGDLQRETVGVVQLEHTPYDELSIFCLAGDFKPRTSASCP